MVRNVKILAVHMYVYDLDVVIDLLRCFPCLEELYIKVTFLIYRVHSVLVVTLQLVY